MLECVRLYGHLGTRFGREHWFAVRSPAEALRALAANFPGFEAALCEHLPGYAVYRGGHRAAAPELLQHGRGVIRLVPVLAGAKSDTALIITGLVLMLLVAPVGAALLADYSISAAAFFQFAVANIGFALAVQGVSNLLFSAPKPDSGERPENKPSYAFNGPVNTQAQGAAVPVGYGRLIVGGAVIAAGLNIDDQIIAPPPSGIVGQIIQTTHADGEG